MGIYDGPATVDYILENTGVKKLTLVAFSMGTTVSYVLLSSKPEYNEKIELLIALAPAAIFTHPMTNSLVRVVNDHMYGAYVS